MANHCFGMGESNPFIIVLAVMTLCVGWDYMCVHVWDHARSCDFMWLHVTSCNIMWPYVTSCNIMWPYDIMWPHVTPCDIMWHVTPCDIMWPHVSPCDLMWLPTPGVWWWVQGVHGDGDDEGRWTAGPHPGTKVLLRKRSSLRLVCFGRSFAPSKCVLTK